MSADSCSTTTTSTTISSSSSVVVVAAGVGGVAAGLGVDLAVHPDSGVAVDSTATDAPSEALAAAEASSQSTKRSLLFPTMDSTNLDVLDLINSDLDEVPMPYRGAGKARRVLPWKIVYLQVFILCMCMRVVEVGRV
jgi:hypothetical protein